MKPITAPFAAAPALLLAACLLFAPAAPAGGAEAAPLSGQTRRALAYVQEKLPTLQAGDEIAVFALLRGGLAYPIDDGIQQYLAALDTHLNAGGIAGQSTAQSAWQALALAAAGQDAGARAPLLLQALANQNVLQDAGLNAACLTLLAFGPGSLPVPQGLDMAALAQGVAGSRNTDGGFGEGGVSSPAATAVALQALAFYRQQESIGGAVSGALAYLASVQNAYGGFDDGGAPSPATTAQAVLAMACLRHPSLNDALPHPADALLVFQNEDGGFSVNPDTPPDTGLTSIAALALLAHDRLGAQLPSVYEMAAPEGAASLPPTAPPESGTPASGAAPALALPRWLQGSVRIPGLPAIPLVWAAAAAAGLLLLFLLLALTARRRLKKRRLAAQPPGGAAALPPQKKVLPKGSARRMEKLERTARKEERVRGEKPAKKRKKKKF